MNAPNPFPPPSGAVPTTGALLGAAGGALATVLVGVSNAFGHPLDATTAAGIATLATFVFGYLHPDGRQFK